MNEQATRIRADLDIRDFGARENIAPATNRAAINAAIAAASSAGGGRVIIPKGEWTTGTVELLSGVELHLDVRLVVDTLANHQTMAGDTFPNARERIHEGSGPIGAHEGPDPI